MVSIKVNVPLESLCEKNVYLRTTHSEAINICELLRQSDIPAYVKSGFDHEIGVEFYEVRVRLQDADMSYQIISEYEGDKNMREASPSLINGDDSVANDVLNLVIGFSLAGYLAFEIIRLMFWT